MIDIIMPISNRLKYVRTYDLYTQEYIASFLGVKQPTYAGWENNRSIIPLKHLNSLSNFYNLNVDYLLGLTDEKRDIIKKEIDIRISSKRFKQIREELNLSQSQLAKILNVAKSTITGYENGDFMISTHAIYDLAKNFNISVDWILDKSKIKEIIKK